MKIKSVKKVLTATLLSAMLAASTLTVAASGGSSGSSGSGSSGSGSGGDSGAVEQPAEQPSAPSESSSSHSSSKSKDSSDEEETYVDAYQFWDNNGGGSDNGFGSDNGGGSSEEQSPFAPTVKIYSASTPILLAGSQVRTTVAGAFDVKEAQGAAVVTPLSEVKASLGLTGSQAPYVMVFDTDAKKSNLAMGCVSATAEALGGEVVTSVNVTLGAKENGKIVSLANGSAGMAVGLPKGADQSKSYSVVCVQPGGVISILEDQDSSPATVTFEVKAGIGTYGIIAK